jgi:hypothetical protein
MAEEAGSTAEQPQSGGLSQEDVSALTDMILQDDTGFLEG